MFIQSVTSSVSTSIASSVEVMDEEGEASQVKMCHSETCSDMKRYVEWSRHNSLSYMYVTKNESGKLMRNVMSCNEAKKTKII